MSKFSLVGSEVVGVDYKINKRKDSNEAVEKWGHQNTQEQIIPLYWIHFAKE